MRREKYKELFDSNEIKFLRDDIKEDFNGFPDVKKTTAKYILNFNEIIQEGTLLTIYNFISTNELNFKIKPIKFNDKSMGIQIVMF